MNYLKILKNIVSNLKDVYFEKVQLPFYSFVDFLKDLTKSKEDIRDFNKKVTEALDKQTKNVEKYKELMDQVRDVSKEQKEIQGYLMSPQQGSLDASYRNSLNATLMELDQIKIEKLQQILDLGFDPILKVFKKDGYTEGPLSELISSIKKESPVNQKPKLTIIQGGKHESESIVK